jgi:type IV pilus assembly protein PilM
MEIGSMRFHQAIATKLGISLAEARALRRRLLEGPETPEGEASAEAPPQVPATSQRDPVRQAVFDATRSAMEQLARELSLCVRYQSVTFRGHRPTRVRLLGPEANDPHLQTILHSVLNIRVEAGRPLFNVDASRMREQDRRGTASEWATALGLALKRTTGRFAARDGRPRGSVAAAVPAGEAGEAVGTAQAGPGAADATGEVSSARA